MMSFLIVQISVRSVNVYGADLNRLHGPMPVLKSLTYTEPNEDLVCWS